MTENEVPLDESPGKRIEDAVALMGEREVAVRAASLLAGGNEGQEFLLWVGGRHAQGVLDGAPPLYWPEVWGARALMYAWDDEAAPAVIRGLSDQAWRVREMCAKVCVTHQVASVDQLTPLLGDQNPRVRAAGLRAIAEIGTEAVTESMRALLKDPEKDVRRQAQQSLERLTKR